MNLLFNSDIVKLLVKTNEAEGLIFYFFLVWSALIVGWLVMPAWNRKSCLGQAESTYFVFLVLFKDG